MNDQQETFFFTFKFGNGMNLREISQWVGERFRRKGKEELCNYILTSKISNDCLSFVIQAGEVDQQWNSCLCIPSCLKTNTHTANKRIGLSLFCAGCFTAPLWEEWREWQALDSAKEAAPGSEARQRGGHCGRSIQMDVNVQTHRTARTPTLAACMGTHTQACIGCIDMHVSQNKNT